MQVKGFESGTPEPVPGYWIITGNPLRAYTPNFWDKKGKYFFMDRECIFKLVKYFCPRMAKGGVC